MPTRWKVAWLLIGAALTSTALWFSVVVPAGENARRERILTELPALPDFHRQNEQSIRLFREAHRLVREDPLSPGRLGSLAMLLHAYQFVDEARQAYQLARGLEPREVRWAYYFGMLERYEFNFGESERQFRAALELQPNTADAWAELGDLRLKSHRVAEAEADFRIALDIDPLQPVAALGLARILMLSNRWQEIVRLLTPLDERYPRLSQAKKYLARAYGELGRVEDQERHRISSEYGSAADSEWMEELYELAVPAILVGEPTHGPGLIQAKCAKCHTHDRIYDTEQTRAWWARTVRRMQRLAGWQWLTDEEAANVTAYLASREIDEPVLRSVSKSPDGTANR